MFLRVFFLLFMAWPFAQAEFEAGNQTIDPNKYSDMVESVCHFLQQPPLNAAISDCSKDFQLIHQGLGIAPHGEVTIRCLTVVFPSAQFDLTAVFQPPKKVIVQSSENFGDFDFEPQGTYQWAGKSWDIEQITCAPLR